MSNFTARLNPPTTKNKYYIKNTYGGYNKAMVINEKTGECIPNCCGLVHGRWLECIGSTDLSKDNLCLGDAKNYYSYKDGYVRSQSPQVGDIACWSGGEYGHVAFVERVNEDGSIYVSNSMYDGKRWYYRTIKKPYNYKGITDMKFLGFIRNPYVKIDSKEELEVGDKVQIIASGNASSYGTGWRAYGIGYKMYILKIYPDREYPYQVGNDNGTTGFYKASALKKL